MVRMAVAGCQVERLLKRKIISAAVADGSPMFTCSPRTHFYTFVSPCTPFYTLEHLPSGKIAEEEDYLSSGSAMQLLMAHPCSLVHLVHISTPLYPLVHLSTPTSSSAVADGSPIHSKVHKSMESAFQSQKICGKSA